MSNRNEERIWRPHHANQLLQLHPTRRATHAQCRVQYFHHNSERKLRRPSICQSLHRSCKYATGDYRLPYKCCAVDCCLSAICRLEKVIIMMNEFWCARTVRCLYDVIILVPVHAWSAKSIKSIMREAFIELLKYYIRHSLSLYRNKMNCRITIQWSRPADGHYLRVAFHSCTAYGAI